MADTDIITIPHESSGLALSRPPEKVLEEAKRAAKALLEVVRQTGAAVRLGNSEHLKFEAWSTCARFYGVVAKVREVRFVEYGGFHGFEATADAVRADTGEVLASASAMCLNDEERWRERTVYEWKENPQTGRKYREAKGTEPVPLFQLSSMAQTRAGSKVLRMVFSWLVVLAGFSPTPAEEMTGNETSAEEPQRGAPPAGDRKVEWKKPTGDGSAPADGIVIDTAPHKQGKKKNGDEWTSYRIVLDDGTIFFTFDKKHHDDALAAMNAKQPVKVFWKMEAGYATVTKVAVG